MDNSIFNTLTTLPSQLDSVSILKLTVVISAILLIWFLPTVIALALRREKLKFIVIANCACLLSHILWVGLLIWVITGKATSQKLKQYLDRRNQSSS